MLGAIRTDSGPHDGRVGEYWTTSDDPRDEAFYSTVFVKLPPWTFDGPECGTDCEPPAEPPGWRFKDQCVACETVRVNALPNLTLPSWEVADKCKLCGERPKVTRFNPPSPPPIPPCLIDCVDQPPRRSRI